MKASGLTPQHPHRKHHLVEVAHSLFFADEDHAAVGSGLVGRQGLAGEKLDDVRRHHPFRRVTGVIAAHGRSLAGPGAVAEGEDVGEALDLQRGSRLDEFLDVECKKNLRPEKTAAYAQPAHRVRKQSGDCGRRYDAVLKRNLLHSTHTG